MVSIDDLKEVLHGLFNEHIIEPIKFKMELGNSQMTKGTMLMRNHAPGYQPEQFLLTGYM